MKINRVVILVLLAMIVFTTGQAMLHPVTADAAGRTIRKFPKALRGTWYTYNQHHLYRLKIATTAITDNDGRTIHLHSRKLSSYPKPGTKAIHPTWVTGLNFTNQKEKWTQVYGWYQTAGAGDFYRVAHYKIHGKKIPVLQVASGAGIWTDVHGFQSKSLARHYTHKHFHGERYRD